MSTESFEQVREEVKNVLREKVYNKYKTTQATTWQIDSGLQRRLEDAWLRDHGSEITKKIEELEKERQENIKQVAKLQQELKELPKQIDRLVTEGCELNLKKHTVMRSVKNKVGFDEICKELHEERKKRLKMSK